MDSTWRFADPCSERWGPELLIEEKSNFGITSLSETSRVSADHEEDDNATDMSEQPIDRADNQEDHIEQTQEDQSEDVEAYERVKKSMQIFNGMDFSLCVLYV